MSPEIEVHPDGIAVTLAVGSPVYRVDGDTWVTEPRPVPAPPEGHGEPAGFPRGDVVPPPGLALVSEPIAGELRARTANEANLYADVTQCECGEVRWSRSAICTRLPDGGRGLHYADRCLACERNRVLDFRLPEESQDVSGPRELIHGLGSEPSALLDMGQWVEVARAYAAREDEPQVLWMMAAISAVCEAQKWACHDEFDVVPATAFWSPEGRALQVREPEVFCWGHLDSLMWDHMREFARRPGRQHSAMLEKREQAAARKRSRRPDTVSALAGLSKFQELSREDELRAREVYQEWRLRPGLDDRT